MINKFRDSICEEVPNQEVEIETQQKESVRIEDERRDTPTTSKKTSLSVDFGQQNVSCPLSEHTKLNMTTTSLCEQCLSPHTPVPPATPLAGTSISLPPTTVVSNTLELMQ